MNSQKVKTFSSLVLFVLVSLLLLAGCDLNIDNDETQSQVIFELSSETSIQTINGRSVQKSVNQLDEVTALIVTIEDADQNIIHNRTKIDLINMNGNFITLPIELKAGAYKLIEYFVVDASGNALFAAPKTNSEAAHVVGKPLPIEVILEKDKVTKIKPEILSTKDLKPEDFGYSSFSFEVVEFVLDKWNKTVLIDSVYVENGFDYIKDGSDEYIAAFCKLGPSGGFMLYKNGDAKLCDGDGSQQYYYPDITVHNSKVCIATEYRTGEETYVKHLTWDSSSGYNSTSPFGNETYNPQIAYGDLYSTLCIFNGKYFEVIACINNEVFVTNTEIGYHCATKLAYDRVNKIAHIAVIANGTICYSKFNANTEQFEIKSDIGLFGGFIYYIQSAKRRSDICIDDSNNPHIVFTIYNYSYYGTNTYSLAYKYFDGTTWQSASIENDALPELKSIDAVAITYTDNRIHVAFMQGNSVYYAYRVGGQWYIREAANDACNTYPDMTNLRINVQKSGPDPEITIAYINSNKELVKVVSTRY